MSSELENKEVRINSKSVVLLARSEGDRFLIEFNDNPDASFAIFRVGNDIIVKFSDGRTLLIKGFYDENFEASELVIGEKIVRSDDVLAVLSSNDGVSLIAYAGDRESLLKSLDGELDFKSAFEQRWLADVLAVLRQRASDHSPRQASPHHKELLRRLGQLGDHRVYAPLCDQVSSSAAQTRPI